jgi:hypothetical protein
VSQSIFGGHRINTTVILAFSHLTVKSVQQQHDGTDTFPQLQILGMHLGFPDDAFLINFNLLTQARRHLSEIAATLFVALR